MRIELPKLTDSPLVRELLDKARSAPTLGEAAYFNRLARQASEGASA